MESCQGMESREMGYQETESYREVERYKRRRTIEQWRDTRDGETSGYGEIPRDGSRETEAETRPDKND